MGNADSRERMSTTSLSSRDVMEVEVGEDNELQVGAASRLSATLYPSFPRRGDPAPVVPSEGSGVGFGLPRASPGGNGPSDINRVGSSGAGVDGGSSTPFSASSSGPQEGGRNLPAAPKCDSADAERRRRSRIAKIMRMSNVSWVEKQRLIQSVRNPGSTGEGNYASQTRHVPSVPADSSPASGSLTSSSSVKSLGFAGSSSVAVQTPEPPKLGDLKVQCEHYGE